jgi:cell division protease FtsH
MSDKLGFVRYTGEDSREMFMADRDYSEETAKLIDEEIRRIVDEAYADATRMLDEHWDAVTAVAEALLKHETLTADEVKKLMAGERLDKPSVSELLDAEAKKMTAERHPRPEPADDRGDELGPGAIPSPA